MAPLLDTLRSLGVRIDDGGRGALPFTVQGVGHVVGGAATIDGAGSSQFVSAMLLTGFRFDQGLELGVTGHLPSLPHVEMTVSMLAAAGVDVTQLGPTTWRVRHSAAAGGERVVAPDLSNAAPFLAAAVLTGGRVTVPGWAGAVHQPSDAIRGVFRRLGASDALLPDGSLVVEGMTSVPGVDVDLSDLPELLTTVAVMAALGDSPTTIRGVAHVRGHETDRLAALAAEINGLGGDVTETDDGLVVRPRTLHGGVFHTYADHRMATAAAVLGLVVPGVLVEDVATTSKTLPDFAGRWSTLIGSHVG